jgi:hypothetical protein
VSRRVWALADSGTVPRPGLRSSEKSTGASGAGAADARVDQAPAGAAQAAQRARVWQKDLSKRCKRTDKALGSTMLRCFFFSFFERSVLVQLAAGCLTAQSGSSTVAETSSCERWSLCIKRMYRAALFRLKAAGVTAEGFKVALLQQQRV